MAYLGHYNLFLTILSLSYMTNNMAAAGASVVRNSNTTGATNFIRLSCRATLYPVICFQSLSVFATTIQQNDRQLTKTAISVSLAKARFTTMFVSKLTKVSGIRPRESRAVKDCVKIMGDTIDLLSRSIVELDHVHGGQEDFMWRMSNVETWVSAALTNEKICMDGFSYKSMEGNIKAAVRKRIVSVVQVTSNALALVYRFAQTHQAAAVTTMP